MRMTFLLGAALVLAASDPAANAAADAAAASASLPLDPAVLARANALSHPLVSPDGRNVSLLVSANSEQGLTILDAKTRAVAATLIVPPGHQLDWYRWAGPHRLVFKLVTKIHVLGIETRGSRLMLFDLADRRLNDLGPPKVVPLDDEVVWIDPAGERMLVATRRMLVADPEVREVPLDGTGAKVFRVVQPPKNGVARWVADADGVIRYGWGQRNGKTIAVWYRDGADQPLRRVADFPVTRFVSDAAFRVYVSPGSPQALMLERGDKGRVVLTRRNLTSDAPPETLLALPDADVTALAVDRQGNLERALVEDDTGHTHWFTPSFQRLEDKLRAALKGDRVEIVSRADDNSRMVVASGSERDPGAFWLFEPTTGNLSLLSEFVPGLDLARVATPKAVTYTARDGTPIRAYLTLPPGEAKRPRALVIMPHGGPYDVRDYLQFDPWVQFLATRGYAVIQPNYRGSSGYGLDFVRLGDGQFGRAMQDDLDDAMDWAVRQGIADPHRVCIVGASYGGYAALWGVIRNPERYRCAASFAGVTNIRSILRYDRRFFSSENFDRYETKIRGDDDFDLDTVSPQVQVGRLTRPVLLAHGDADVRVPFAQYEAMVSAASKAGKPLQTIVLKGEGHGLSKPENRLRWLETLGAFLAANNPAD